MLFFFFLKAKTDFPFFGNFSINNILNLRNNSTINQSRRLSSINIRSAQKWLSNNSWRNNRLLNGISRNNWLMNNLFFSCLILNFFNDSFLRNIFNIFVIKNLRDIFLLVFNSIIVSHFFFFRNILSVIKRLLNSFIVYFSSFIRNIPLK
jgi:hypothetical protein